jgi:UDP-N-acetylglucosamine:LPS N-acetylglucosamine transferase
VMLGLIGDDHRLQQLSENIKHLGIPDASERIVAEVLKLAESK